MEVNHGPVSAAQSLYPADDFAGSSESEEAAEEAESDLRAGCMKATLKTPGDERAYSHRMCSRLRLHRL